MKRFLISLSVLFSFASAANACGYDDQSDKYYMFSYCDNSFRENYENSMDKFWMEYCKKDYRPWHDELVKAAKAKNDRDMLIYLQQLKAYSDISDDVQNTWNYPTALDLAKRKQNLRNIITVANANLGGKYGNRWALLKMRANMLLDNHQDNITFFTTKTKNYPNDCYKDMMRNIYARDLLLTGKKQQAWNIYAEQNDQQSLLWSVRKFTNLAGIKSICAEDANAPVLNYLVQTYVNRIQSLIDERENEMPYLDYTNVIWGRAYAQVSGNQSVEFKNFIAHAKQMAQGGQSKVPCMWMSAAALVNYFLNDYKQANQCIDLAMNMRGTDAMKNNARRIRMLIKPTVTNIQSSEFRSFIAQELRWLDSQVRKDGYSNEAMARERIIKHVLADEYNRMNDATTVLALNAVADFNDYNNFSDYYHGRFNYSSISFDLMKNMTAKEVEQFFNTLDNNSSDALSSYFSERLASRYSADFRNDLIGTKFLAENKLADALPYLQKVQHAYLEDQAIAYYVYQRDYKTPFWNGFQTLEADMYDEEGEPIKYPLKGNVKIDFCKDVIALQNKYGAADVDSRKQIAYQLAGYYYQASYKGQCWFLTHYGQSIMDEQNPKEANFPAIARKYLQDAASSTDNNLKLAAMFAQIATAPDRWGEYVYDADYNQVFQINYASEQYAALKKLTNYTRTTGFEPEYISNCDVIEQFRNNL